MTYRILLVLFMNALSLIMFTHYGTGGKALAKEQVTSAKQVVIIDMNTGSILLDKNSTVRMPTSSMSKVMTMYAVFEAIKAGRLSLDDRLTVSEKAWKKGGSKMFVEAGKTVLVEDLIKGVIVQSGNDAAIVLAENLSGTEDDFARNLNIIARKLGMNNSNFKNASGWPDPEHYSTAMDLAILAQRLIIDFPEFYGYYGIKEFTFNGIKQANRNPLLYRKMGVDGIKTGHTDIAGYGLMASGLREGRRIIMVANGMESEKHRAQESARLMEWALSSFENRVLYKREQELVKASVVLGTQDNVPLILGQDINVTLPRLDQGKVKIQVVYGEPMQAPLTKGQEAGKLIITIPDQEQQVYPLYVGADVPEASFIKQALEKLILLIGQG